LRHANRSIQRIFEATLAHGRAGGVSIGEARTPALRMRADAEIW
jgi:hypothetical protein